MAFSFTDYVLVIDPPWTWTRIPTSVTTQLLFELPPYLFEVPPYLFEVPPYLFEVPPCLGGTAAGAAWAALTRSDVDPWIKSPLYPSL
jgi:hypothetical protein